MNEKGRRNEMKITGNQNIEKGRGEKKTQEKRKERDRSVRLTRNKKSNKRGAKMKMTRKKKVEGNWEDIQTD